MSETGWVLVITAIPALTGLGVAALAVTSHPDRAKAAKLFFSIAAVVLAGATLYWTMSTERGLFGRVAVDLVAATFIAVGLTAGFRFANRSSLAELSLPSSAFFSESLWPANKKLIVILSIGILAVIAVINTSPTPGRNAIGVVAGWVSVIPWRWVLPSIAGTSAIAIVVFLITRRHGRHASDNSSSCSYKWAHEIADYEKRRIQKFVLVEDCVINASYLSKGELYVDFTFSILNLSMYTVSIRMAEGTVIENSILFKGNMLSRDAKLAVNNVKHTNPTDRDNFTIRQWVNPDEAKEIIQTLEKSGNLFDFSRAAVYISIDEFPDAEVAKIDLTRGMQNAALENKLVEMGNANTWLKSGLSLWKERSGNIEELTRTLGMFYRAYNQLEQGELLSPETGNSLRGRFMLALSACFHDQKLEDEYSDNLPPLPDSIPDQKNWIDSQCVELRSLITEQKKGLSDYVRKDG